MLLIVLIESLALLLGAVPANWTHIDHAISELDESSPIVKHSVLEHISFALPFDRDFEVRDVVQTKVD